MVICRAWQAELGKLGGGTGGSEGDLVVGRGSECWMETEAQACLPHPFQSLQSNSPSQGAASGLGSPPLKSISWPHSPAKETDGQTDVGHSCSPVRRLEQVWGSLELCSAVAGQTTPILRRSLPASPALWNKGSYLEPGVLSCHQVSWGQERRRCPQALGPCCF